ncbi:Exonuclease [Eumeta japonica]|uniref:Exonuclease n=1 Tax=Eumeta variegata TaxID=151549 RepID=A0A4C1XZ58_EUMVA|nr:Exonuclease [Eumeta japonica]
MRLRKYTCPPELQSKYEEKIVADRSECLSISVLSESQSDCFEWFEERAKRVTCSSKAHRIKTRRDAFESLASQFKKNKFDGKMTEAMKYGLETESNARKSFEEQSGLKVTSVGLIINMTQPFMATSPDGIILSESSLLEIKCPFSCKNQQIVNRDDKVSNVPYLKIDENNDIYLKKSDKYYTQIQVSMYILNVNKCHFFVYSSRDNVELIVERDEHFLEELIPKIEWFYFQHYLPLLF